MVFSCSLASAQSRKAKRAYDNAQEEVAKYEWNKALEYLNEAIEDDPNYFDARLLQGDIHFRFNRFPEAVEAYKAALDPNKELYKTLLYKLGKTEYQIGAYADAKAHFEDFLTYTDVSPNSIKVAENHLERIEVALELKKTPYPFNPVNLGPNVNTERYEYLPALSADGNQLVFTRRVFTNGIDNEDFYTSNNLGDTAWSVAEELVGKINTPGNEGAQCITADGSTLFFTGCDREKSYGRCDIYLSVFANGYWSEPINLGPEINTRAWESQPSISADGRDLYFVSNRKGGYGGKDIWKSSYIGRGQWTEPENLGPNVNTNKDEISPFIHWDDETLYYASSGHPGMGGLDLFLSRKNSKNEWSPAENLGYPINHYGDQSSLIVASDGKTAYFTSELLDGYGLTDLYEFELPDTKLANDIAYMRGNIYDAITKKSLQAEIQLIDLADGSIYRTIETGKAGNYFVVLPSSRDFALQIKKDKYLFYSSNFSLKSGTTEGREFEKDVYLQPIKVNATLALNNVFFNTNSYDLLPSSFTELDELVNLLKTNETVTIEIGGHTDDVGSEADNQKLSENRAKSVYTYLASKGIDKTRMTYKGYGEAKPVDTNDTEAGRAANRRTEIKITKK